MRLLSLFALVLITSPLSVQAENRRFGIGARFGGAFPVGSQQIVNRANPGVFGGTRIRYALDPRWNVIADFDSLNMPDTNGIVANAFHFGGLYSFKEEGWRPGVFAALGGAVLDQAPITTSQQQASSTHFGAKFGATLEIQSNEGWLFAPEVAYHINAPNTTTKDSHFLTLGATLGFQFGGNSKPRVRKSRRVRKQPNALVRGEAVSISLEVEFASAQDVIRPQYRGKIKKVADFLKEHPRNYATIEGHTDSRGNRDYNIDLSQRRADAVRRVLIDDFGIAARRLTARGYGPDKPLDTNDTAAGRQRNRRVIATITGQ
jgi:outer membrane protein OmpA-like peptidoglycan-associated protein